jgi:tRNA A37 threonylcarbamoyladenosine synthetase subunit TsaC/SUA5/YrdC
MATKNFMGLMVSPPDAAPTRSLAAVKKRPRNAGMDALVKHAHSSERFSFASVAAAVSAARGKKTKS